MKRRQPSPRQEGGGWLVSCGNDELLTATLHQHGHGTVETLTEQTAIVNTAARTIRETHTTSRELEYFTEKELTLQIGAQPSIWLLALIKEMMDNALDGCEQAGVSPVVMVDVDGSTITVADNGCGIPPDTVKRSLDYNVRVSDKSYYVSPTRGQLGNALKCLWAAPFVLDGESGHVEVLARCVHHDIRVSLDRLAQKPRIEYSERPCEVKTGTIFRLHGPEQAGLPGGPKARDFYRALLSNVVKPFSIFNPHATFGVKHPSSRKGFVAVEPLWKKWLASWPTSPHWYTGDTFRDLLAASIRAGDDRRPKMLRDWLGTFDGLKGTGRRKEVLESAGLGGLTLRDLVKDGDVDMTVCRNLLSVMREQVRPLKPQALGIIGEASFRSGMARCLGIASDAFRYKRVLGHTDAELPFVVEAAFAPLAWENAERILVTGLNWTPTLNVPSFQIEHALQDTIIDDFDPVAVCLHVACPRFTVTDRGKGRVEFPRPMATAVHDCIRLAAQEWTASKKRRAARERMAQRDLEELRKGAAKKMTITDAANQVMEEAYLKASDGGDYPANARQIMYAARPLILALTGGKFCKKSSTFTQKILPAYIRDNPDKTAEWDVVFDARGHLEEPHTERRIELGTIAVRDYCDSWIDRDRTANHLTVNLDKDYATCGPDNRFSFALFVEKEGFDSLLRKSRIAKRFDVALMSTKGMSVTAARHLVEQLTIRGVTILVLHDFDKSGFSILETLRSDTSRYVYKVKPRIFDLGLRLADALAMGLQSEPVEYRKVKKDPRIRLAECGATPEECDFLAVQRGHTWVGERVELNAMTSPQFLSFLEENFEAHGVKKVVPAEKIVEDAYRRAYVRTIASDAANEAAKECDVASITIPDDLLATITKKVKGKPMPWDDAVALMATINAREDREAKESASV